MTITTTANENKRQFIFSVNEGSIASRKDAVSAFERNQVYSITVIQPDGQKNSWSAKPSFMDSNSGKPGHTEADVAYIREEYWNSVTFSNRGINNLADKRGSNLLTATLNSATRDLTFLWVGPELFADIQRKRPKGNPNPQPKLRTRSVYEGSPAVRREALARQSGCAVPWCKHLEEFPDQDSRECHHTKGRAVDDTLNTVVALCLMHHDRITHKRKGWQAIDRACRETLKKLLTAERQLGIISQEVTISVNNAIPERGCRSFGEGSESDPNQERAGR